MHSIDQKEINKFNKISYKNWSNFDGSMKMLHFLNPIRIKFLQTAIQQFMPNKTAIKILDYGCGAGILSINLSKLNFCVYSFDPSQQVLKNAQEYAQTLNINDIHFINQEEHIPLKEFDIVICSEVLEHINHDQYPQLFHKIDQFLKNENALLIITTINRTLKSLILHKFTAEYLLNMIPQGTHEFKKFIKPHEINKNLQSINMKIQKIQGMKFNIKTQTIEKSNKIDGNYMFLANR